MNRDNWTLFYATTSTDGLQIKDAFFTFGGSHKVIEGADLPWIFVDYLGRF